MMSKRNLVEEENFDLLQTWTVAMATVSRRNVIVNCITSVVLFVVNEHHLPKKKKKRNKNQEEALDLREKQNRHKLLKRTC